MSTRDIPLPRYPDNCPKCRVAWEVCTCFQEPDMTALCDELRLALARQREVNETLVGALDVVRTYHPDAGYAPWESTLQVVLAALAAAREVKP